MTWLEADTSRLKETGLYRISGGLSSIHKLKEAAEKDATTFVIPPSEDTHSVTGVLKLYLREMTDPLVPFDLYSSFIAAASSEEGKDEKIQTAVSTLPPGNKLIFDKLFYHLNKVTTHSLENKMDSKNLAVVFAPTILRPPNDDLETVFGDAVFSNELVSGLIERPDYFIPLTSDNEFPLHTDTQDPAPVPPTPLHDSPSKTLPHTHSMPSTIVPPSPSSSSKKSKSKSKLMISSKKLNYTTKEDNHNMEKEGKE
uniref:Rho-GAP domain-containing protein n=1 Tax=Arcella intermedia TaxID=1963864 RepID=A0A6B2LEE4_9EUKA